MPTDNTLDPTTVAAFPADSTYIADETAANTIAETSVSAAETEDQQERDQVTWRVNQDGGV